jgi:hypothetical protein
LTLQELDRSPGDALAVLAIVVVATKLVVDGPVGEHAYGTSVEPHQSASPSGTRSTGVGTNIAIRKQMVAMSRTILLGVMGIPLSTCRLTASAHHSSNGVPDPRQRPGIPTAAIPVASRRHHDGVPEA